MAEQNWWRNVQPHRDIREGRVDESLFAADLGQAVKGEGPAEYADARVFFGKTYLTDGLRKLLVNLLRTLAGDRGQNPVVSLQTSFGGGKTHAELAAFHLLAHSAEALRVDQVRELLDTAGVKTVPPCRVAVLPCTSLNPLGRSTDDGVQIHALWGEVAYQLGGKAGYALVARNDASLQSPGEDDLAKLLGTMGPSVILCDETLHYVDKVANQGGAQGNLAANTVAFLRELTVAVRRVPGCALVVSLTSSRLNLLSPQALEWLASMNQHVVREASTSTPVVGSEIHEIVRRRLFENVNEGQAQRVAESYRSLYAGLGGLPARTQGEPYRQLLERSYPFHPELVSVLYERWGTKPGFQLTRGTLRFLALALQHLWARRNDADPDLIQPADLSLAEPALRDLVKEVAGDPAWESVLGSDIAAPAQSEPAKAQLIDRERSDGQRLAEGLATTIFMYSLGGGEDPRATRDELRLACTRRGTHDATWEDLLEKLRRRLFYLYYEEAKYQFRKEPNALSLMTTHRMNLQPGDVDAALRKLTDETDRNKDRALGLGTQTGFLRVLLRPEDSHAVPDDQDLKLVVLGLGDVVEAGQPSESARERMLGILQRCGQVNREYPNTIVFCVADAGGARLAKESARDYLAWRKIEQTASDWDRIGAAQQAMVKEQRGDAESSTLKALIAAYGWAVVPTVSAGSDGVSERLQLQCERLGGFSPGKLIIPRVWDKLTSEDGLTQPILTSLTPETLVQRYGPRAWPEHELWVTTFNLWERFTKQVGLPILAGRQVLLDALRLGQREGLFALGRLNDEKAAPDQRDSYAALYYQEKDMPDGTPGVGDRWLVLRRTMYDQIEHQPAQVSPAEVREVIEKLDGGGQPVRVGAVYEHVKALKGGKLDDESFRKSLDSCISEHGVAYRLTRDGPPLGALPVDAADLMRGSVSAGEPPPPGPVVSPGRVIGVRGTLAAVGEFVQLYQNLLRVLGSQNPTRVSIHIDVSAEYASDPGSAFDAALAEGSGKFPGLTMTDSKHKK